MRKPSDQAPAPADVMPQRGGSHIRQTDGSLTRTAFTIAPGETGHPATPAPAPPPVKPAKET